MGDFVPTMQVLRSRNDLLFFQLPYFEIYFLYLSVEYLIRRNYEKF